MHARKGKKFITPSKLTIIYKALEVIIIIILFLYNVQWKRKKERKNE